VSVGPQESKKKDRILGEIRRRELRNLSEKEGLRAINTLLELGAVYGWRRPEREQSLGLIERQKRLYGIK